MTGRHIITLLLLPLFMALSGCGVYSFTGATIEGKTINIHQLDNRARNVVPSLSPTLTDKIRSRILSQTGLKPVTAKDADYDLSGYVSSYEVTVTGVQAGQVASKNRLTITVQIDFKNRLNDKSSFSQAFTGFSDFSATQVLQTVESNLIQDIATRMADDIFNKAFVNW